MKRTGTSVKGAYDVLVSMSVITYFLPSLFLFGSMIVLQREPAGPGVMRVPGGRPVALGLACVGLVSTAVTIVLSVMPAADEGHKTLAVAKVLGVTAALVALGVGLFVVAKVRQRQLNLV